MTAGLQPVEVLWRDLHGRIASYVRRHVPPSDADDVVQDVFLRIHVGLPDVGRLDAADAWVHRVARNAVIDWYRRRRPTTEVEDVAVVEDDVEDEATRGGLAGCMRPFVERLPEPYREALALTDLGEMTQAEAARHVGISVSGMKTRVQRGRERLRALFEACCRFEVDRRGAVIAYTPRCAC